MSIDNQHKTASLILGLCLICVTAEMPAQAADPSSSATAANYVKKWKKAGTPAEPGSVPGVLIDDGASNTAAGARSVTMQAAVAPRSASEVINPGQGQAQSGVETTIITPAETTGSSEISEEVSKEVISKSPTGESGPIPGGEANIQR